MELQMAISNTAMRMAIEESDLGEDMKEMAIEMMDYSME